MRKNQEEKKRLQPWIGKSFLIIGTLHSIVGLVAFRDSLGGLFSDHLLNTVSLKGDPGRLAAFWFLLTGCTLMIIGGLVDWIETRNIGMPAFLAWGFAAITVTGVLVMPASGFWLLLVPAFGLFSRSRTC